MSAEWNIVYQILGPVHVHYDAKASTPLQVTTFITIVFTQ